MRRQAVIRTKPDRALCARRTFPFIAARMLTRRPYRLHAPKRWSRLAQAAAQDPDSAALVLARAHDCVWRTLPHAVIADLARSAARTPKTATAALKDASELVWRALSADDIGAVIQGVACHTVGATVALCHRSPSVQAALTADMLRTLAHQVASAPLSATRVLYDAPMSVWKTLDAETIRMMVHTVARRHDCAAIIARMTSAAIWKVLDDDAIRSLARGILPVCDDAILGVHLMCTSVPALWTMLTAEELHPFAQAAASNMFLATEMLLNAPDGLLTTLFPDDLRALVLSTAQHRSTAAQTLLGIRADAWASLDGQTKSDLIHAALHDSSAFVKVLQSMNAVQLLCWKPEIFLWLNDADPERWIAVLPFLPDEVLHEALIVMANDVLQRRDTRDTLRAIARRNGSDVILRALRERTQRSASTSALPPSPGEWRMKGERHGER
ncbi:hypothetical protein [Roseiflexus castenholzii]|uniref:hypothetical protein n=1 Tax=Roseiflexus castenholzii TaxID=120962 RepID=UPI003C7A2EF9